MPRRNVWIRWALLASSLCQAQAHAQSIPEQGAIPTALIAKPSADPGPKVVAKEPELDPWILHSKDHRFTLKIGAQIQVRYTASNAQQKSERNAFKIQEARPQLRASLGKPWITVFIQPELANVPQLLDLELTVAPRPAFGIRVGQFLTPFSRTFYTPVPKLLFQDFSIANNAFRADRQTGAMLFGTPLESRLEYYAGAFNGNRINQNGNDDDTLLFVGRVAASPLGAIAYDETSALLGPLPFRFGLGLNGFYGKVPPRAPTAPAFPLPSGTEPQLLATAPAARDLSGTLGVDLVLHGWLATLQAEYYHRNISPGAGGPHQKGQGAYVHASCFVWFPYLELAARFNYVDPNSSVAHDQTLAYEGAFNVYGLGNNLKLNLRYTRLDHPSVPRLVAGNAPASDQFLAQTQWYF